MREISANTFKNIQDEHDEDFGESIKAEEAIETYISDNMLHWSLPQLENIVDEKKRQRYFIILNTITVMEEIYLIL